MAFCVCHFHSLDGSSVTLYMIVYRPFTQGAPIEIVKNNLKLILKLIFIVYQQIAMPATN